MTSKNVINKKFHAQAEKVVTQYVNDFAKSLITQAKFIAYNAKADVVMSNHVHEALETINNSPKKKARYREIARDSGGILLGLAIQGYIAEARSIDASITEITIYVILLLIGFYAFMLGHSTHD